VKRNSQNSDVRSFDYVVKNVFQMTCRCAACNAVEHQVLRQDTGEISPGKGRDGGGERRRECRFLGVGVQKGFRFEL